VVSRPNGPPIPYKWEGAVASFAVSTVDRFERLIHAGPIPQFGLIRFLAGDAVIFPGFLPAHPALRETFTSIMVTIDGQFEVSS
jgi:hypothetical protein